MIRINSKKGLAIGQVFVFIVAAITFAVIMIFGFRAITDFLNTGEDVSFVQFKTSLEKEVKQIYTEYGSARIVQFYPPTEDEQICFVNMGADYDAELCNKDPIACSVWKDSEGYGSVEENVFLRPVAPVKLKIYEIEINNTGKNYLCLPIVNGVFDLYMEGRGDHTLLMKPEQ